MDEDEWTVIPSKRVVAAGPVTLRVYNRGMDDHDVSLVDATGTLHRVALAPGASTEVRDADAGDLEDLVLAVRGHPESHEPLRDGHDDRGAQGSGARPPPARRALVSAR